MKELNIFEEQTMSSREISELTGKRHDNVISDIKRVLGEVNIHSWDFRSEYVSDNGQKYTQYNLPKRECALVVSGYVAKYRLAIIDRWQELEKSNTPPLIAASAAFEAEHSMAAMRIVADSLKMCESSKLGLYHSIASHYGMPTHAMPKYAIDQSSVSTAGSSEVTYAATVLLKREQIEMSTRAFNVLAESQSYLETKERNSKSKGIKRYKSITEFGREYGKNITNPNQPRETQPHWYEDRFADLLFELGLIL